jgi:hypothetical protein
MAEFAKLTDPNGYQKREADKLIEQAHAAGGGNEARDRGAAFHTFTELHDLGETFRPPPPWDVDIAAYAAALTEACVQIHREWIERIVILDRLQVAGMFDRIVTIDGENVIADLKTGKDVAAYPHDICFQLGCYANADVMFDITTGQRVPMPRVSKERALVIHLPPGGGRCDLYWFDIRAGWDMVDTTVAIKKWRKRTNLATKLVTNPQQRLGLTPTPHIEPAHPTPERPTYTVDEGDRIRDLAAQERRLTEGFDGLGITKGSPEMERWSAWLRAAELGGRPFRFSANPTRRRARLYAAGARLIAATDDDDMAVDLLVAACGPLDVTEPGPCLGTLDMEGAARLLAALAGIENDTLALGYRDDGTPHLYPTDTRKA